MIFFLKKKKKGNCSKYSKRVHTHSPCSQKKSQHSRAIIHNHIKVDNMNLNSNCFFLKKMYIVQTNKSLSPYGLKHAFLINWTN